jgi:hypothetical protein
VRQQMVRQQGWKSGQGAQVTAGGHVVKSSAALWDMVRCIVQTRAQELNDAIRFGMSGTLMWMHCMQTCKSSYPNFACTNRGAALV